MGEERKSTIEIGDVLCVNANVCKLMIETELIGQLYSIAEPTILLG